MRLGCLVLAGDEELSKMLRYVEEKLPVKYEYNSSAIDKITDAPYRQ